MDLNTEQDTITVGILQYNPIQLAKYCNLIGQLRATEVDYIVKCPQCMVQRKWNDPELWRSVE